MLSLNIEALMSERNDVINRINEISRDYELTVRELSEERRSLEI